MTVGLARSRRRGHLNKSTQAKPPFHTRLDRQHCRCRMGGRRISRPPSESSSRRRPALRSRCRSARLRLLRVGRHFCLSFVRCHLPLEPTALTHAAEAARSRDDPSQECSQQSSHEQGEHHGRGRRRLWETGDDRALSYLRTQRGLDDATIRAWGLGFNPADVWDDPTSWGFAPDPTSPERIWLPRGIVIPNVISGTRYSIRTGRWSGECCPA